MRSWKLQLLPSQLRTPGDIVQESPTWPGMLSSSPGEELFTAQCLTPEPCLAPHRCFSIRAIPTRGATVKYFYIVHSGVHKGCMGIVMGNTPDPINNT